MCKKDEENLVLFALNINLLYRRCAVMIAFRQVMSYEMLRIVMIGSAKLQP